MSCQNAQEFLESIGAKVATTQNASKAKIAPAEALQLAKKIDTIHAARGKKVTTFNLTEEKPDDALLLEHLIGRSGFLRAPAAMIGRTLIVGFNADLYRQVLRV